MPIDRDKVLQAAQKYVEKRRFDRAIIEYQKLVQEDPNDARILLKIGDLQARTEAFEAAIATYERVARHYASQGFSVKAIAVYKQIREIIRKHVPQLADQYGHIIPKLAQLYQDLGLTGDALAAYDEYATHLQRAGREREAIDIFHKIVEINGNNPLARLRLAEALLRQNETDEANNQFGVAAEILLGMGRRDDALKVIERMLYQKAETGLARRAAELYLERGHADDGMLALAKLQICFQADHRDLDTLRLLARAFVAIGQSPKAIEVRKEIARIARDQGQLTVAKEAVQELLAEAPDDETVQGLARSILAVERASQAPGRGASEVPASGLPKLVPSDDGVIEVSEEFMDLGDEASIDIETSESGYEELESVDDSLDGGTELMDGPPHSVRAVVVDDGLEAIEDIGSHGQFDATAHVREVLANAAAFRSHHLLHKAIETLRVGLDVNPNAFELRLALKEVLLDAGDHHSACDLMVTIAAVYLDAQDIASAAQSLTEVLSLDPSHPAARQMLVDLGYQVPSELNDTMEVEATRGVTREPMATVEAFPGYENDYAPSSAVYDSSEPLPSYDLEEINPSYAMSSVPPAEEQVDYAALLTTDDPFSTGERAARASQVVIDDPFSEAGGHDAPLPSFPLSEEERVPSELMELDAGYDQLMGDAPPRGMTASRPDGSYSVRSGSYDQPYETGGYPKAARASHPEVEQALPHLEVVEEETYELGYDESPTYNEEQLDIPAPLAGTTRAFMGGDSLEDALEEAEFFESRGLFDDALAILEEQSQRFPNHPLLLERKREVREAMAGAAGSGELVVPHGDVAQGEPVEDHAFDIAASLDVLDGGMMGESETGTDGFGKAVDVEEVFAKFKEGVKQQVSESDSQTHYDLGVAYKEMGLLNDAINEFTMAARDPTRECVCWSMIGIVRLELGSTDGAIEAFIGGLHAEYKTPEQELALYYELGNIYEARGNPQEALYYFEKVRRRDPGFRDVSHRVQSLQASSRRPALRTAVGEDDFDRAFDDLFGDGK